MREFIKNNKWKLIISSLITLLPIAVGVILWDKLPMSMHTHWGLDGNADASSGRTFAVVGLPLILLAFHWLCLFFTSFDKKNRGQNKKVFSMIFFIIPFISLFSNAVIYAAAFGAKFNIVALTVVAMGLMFIIIGNYIPKCKQNSTMGIKIPWTLNNEENWNATHRMAGKLWFAGGIVTMLAVFLPGLTPLWIFMGITAVMIVVPTVYSYLYHKKQVRDGSVDPDAKVPQKKRSKTAVILSAIGVIAVLIFCVIICFTGDMEMVYGDTSFTVKADYYEDLTVEYAVIESVEYCEKDDAGIRIYGFGTPRLYMGSFESKTFGKHTRYSYGGGESCVVIKIGNETLVIGGKNAEATRMIYEAISARVTAE